VAFHKKVRLRLEDFVEEPVRHYPPSYLLSPALAKNEMLLDALRALHLYDFSHYRPCESLDMIFQTLDAGGFVIYKENYVVGYFGQKLMYLEASGWKSLPATREIFLPGNWLV